ncbi:MAG: hypothetical protein ABH864_03610 [archaeon]
MSKVYKNSTKVAQLNGKTIYMDDVVKGCLDGRLNLFLQGNTGDGKTQLARDAMSYFPGESMFILGRNDMDTRELFRQINLGKLFQRPKYNLEPLVNPDTGEIEYFYPDFNGGEVASYRKLTPTQAEVVRKGLEKLAGSTEQIRELTSRINTKLFVTDELPNCVPAVRGQLFNLYDGFIEIDGKAYPIGNFLTATHPDGRVEFLEAGADMGQVQALRESRADIKSDAYSVGIATGNVGQQFTESSNDIGRALRDRMHVWMDVDYFFPVSSDTLEILAGDTNPRVRLESDGQADGESIMRKYQEVSAREVPLEKLLVANYLIHGLDYCSKGSKRRMKSAWPTKLENHEQGSDVGLVLPVSIRGAKSIIRLSQVLDGITKEKGAKGSDHFESMMQAYRLVAPYSGVLNGADVQNKYDGNNYKAVDAVISTTRQQFKDQAENIAAGFEMVEKGKRDKKVLNLFNGRWEFMRSTLDGMLGGK